MSNWPKLPALPGKNNPCANCPPILATLDLDRHIAVGFGAAYVSRDGEQVYDGEEALHHRNEKPWMVRQAEELAAKDPDHDWRICFYAPLHDEVYQRHGPEQWVLVEKGQGFA